jgi:hypothetical protein
MVGIKEDDEVVIKKKCVGCREKSYNFLIGKKGTVRDIRRDAGKNVYVVEVSAHLYTFNRQSIELKNKKRK